MTNPLIISKLAGRGVPILGNDIDTDRIVPARYLKEVTFENMGQYLFRDVRYDGDNVVASHPLNQPDYQQASMMIVEKNFGCGSSREHAPQAIKRAGFRAIIGESFAEIFSGNCKALGIVTAAMDRASLNRLIDYVFHHPSAQIHLDIQQGQLQVDDQLDLPVHIKPTHQRAFLDGTWDELAVLKLNETSIQQVAKKLPYFNW